jgi:DNA-binding NarL/FixJ family response regulator
MKAKPSARLRLRSTPKRQAAPSSKAAHTIFLVEDHPVFRQGLVQLINREADLQVCGHASTVEDAIKSIRRLRPDLVLVDITLPGRSGLDLIRDLRTVDRKTKLLAVSMHDEALYADRVMRAGGDGYIMKQEDPEEVVVAIRDVLSGHIYLSEEVLAGMSASPGTSAPKAGETRIDRLSDCELAVLESLGRGRSSQETAKQLRLNEHMVIKSCAAIKQKLGLKSDNELIRYAVCWVETGET